MSERRSFARVTAELYLSYEKLEKVPESWNRTSTVYLTKTSVEISSNGEHLETQDIFQLLYSALGEIKDELREIKSGMGLKSDHMDKNKIDISGAGVSFFSDQIYKKGDIIEIGVVLPLEMPVLIKAVGEIVGDPQKNSENNQYFYTIQFNTISRDDRELIIRYTFKRQRELINISRKS